MDMTNVFMNLYNKLLLLSFDFTPELWTSLWRKPLYKVADLVLKLPPLSPVWDKSQHEHLTLALCLPLANTHPWRFKHREEVVEMDWKVRGVWKRDCWAAGSLLHKLSIQAWRVRAMP